MKIKPDKYHFVSSSNSQISITAKNANILTIKYAKVLGFKFEFESKFDSHFHDICKKTEEALSISGIKYFMNFNRKRLLVNALSLSQLNYCLLVWMCHNLSVNNKSQRHCGSAE